MRKDVVVEMMEGELLEQYVRGKNDEAFRELVERHAAWVYAVAFRQLSERQAADDATQAVFVLFWAERIRGHHWAERIRGHH